jgi:hypothetical protein
MDIRWTDEQLKAAGIDKRKLKKLLRLLREAGVLMNTMSLEVYGESGSGNLIHRSRPTHDTSGKADLGSVVANVGFGFNGGGW